MPMPFVYGLNPVGATTRFAIKRFTPPSGELVEGTHAELERKHTFIPMTGVEWSQPSEEERDLPVEEESALEKNVHIWELIVRSLTKRHTTAEYENVALVIETHFLLPVLEARHEFFNRVQCSSDDGVDHSEDLRRLCQLYVPVVRLSKDRQRRIFIRWAVM